MVLLVSRRAVFASQRSGCSRPTPRPMASTKARAGPLTKQSRLKWWAKLPLEKCDTESISQVETEGFSPARLCPRQHIFHKPSIGFHVDPLVDSPRSFDLSIR